MRANNAWLPLGLMLFACAGSDPAAVAGPDEGGRATLDDPTDADNGRPNENLVGESLGNELDGAGVIALSPTQHLTRAAMALRGIRPTEAELAAVTDNPARLSAIVDYYLDTPEFGVTLREMHEEALLIGVDGALYPAGFVPRGAVADMDTQALNTALIEAPLRLIEDVVMHDRPYTEIVTADYALANEAVATVWGMRFEPDAEVDAEGWRRAQYDDDRPMAGILSDSFLFTRHSSTVSNKGRGRANVMARALLCYDFLSREIPLDSSIDLADPSAVTDAVRNNPACVSCHQTLDPLAAYFSSYRPIYVPTEEQTYPVRFVRPLYASLLRVTEPSYFGLVSGDVDVLGEMIAQDPRFTACAARRFYGYLAQVEPERVPEALVSTLQGVLLDHDMNARKLAKAVVLSDAFRSSHVSATGSEEDADGLPGLKKARPRQLARSIEALTGYRWRTRLPVDIGTGTIGDVDLIGDALFGFKVLAGGIDSQHVTRPSHTMTATTALTLSNLAERAAAHVVAKDFLIEDPARRWLLTEVERDAADETMVRKQLVKLMQRLFGETVTPDAPSVEDAYRLFTAVRDGAGGDAQRPWAVTLYAMFQDPRFIHF